MAISWPVPLTEDMVTDIKNWLKIVGRKIARSTETKEAEHTKAAS